MANATLTSPAADRNLLYGILALQMGFVTRDTLLSGMQAWVFAKNRSLGDLLQEQGALSPSQCQALDLVAAEHLKAHGGDRQRSLAAVGHLSMVDEALRSVADSELQASIAAAGQVLATTIERPAAERTRYQVLRAHAKGGLGRVSIARDVELGREVALKEIRESYAGDAASQKRFVREAEITGSLEHPGIIPVYGLGCYADGRPYYAMRFIRGETLQEAVSKLHAVEAGYTLRGLLTRFVAVCNAVAYAHSRGVIHRDLKPANVMLGPYGETLVVDWGLAKVVGRDPDSDDGAGSSEMTLQTPSGKGLMTQAGSSLGTPSFMSPEQARGEMASLGPATDIYSLGATLYDVLTGQPPIHGRSAAEVLESVRQGKWQPTRQIKASTPTALDAVCRKAMALKPEDRYDSALSLSADVDRWLADEPVVAYREPWGVRAGRWGRRHRQLVTAAAILLVASVLVSVIVAVNREQARRQTLQAEREVQRQRDIAQANEKTASEREAETKAVLDFVEEKVFAAARPKGEEGGLGPDVTLRRALETAVPFVDTGFREQPLIEARLRLTLGRSFRLLGYPKIAANQVKKARDTYAEHRGPDDPDVLRCMNELGNCFTGLGQYAEAIKVHEETLALRKATLGPDHTDTLKSMNNLASCYNDLGRHAEALKLFEEVLAVRKAKIGTDDPDTLLSMHNLAVGYDHLGRHAEAVKLGEQTLALQKAKLGSDHPDTLKSMHALAVSYDELGRHIDAIKLYEETLALRKVVLGRDHPETLLTMSNLAVSYAALDRHPEAIKLQEETLALQKVKLGPDHPDTLATMYNIACAHAVFIAKSSNRGKEADRAMECLQRAVAAAFDNLPQIKKDSDLDALRDREDFKQLVAKLDAGKWKGKKK